MMWWRLEPGGWMMRFPPTRHSPFWNISRAVPTLDLVLKVNTQRRWTWTGGMWGHGNNVQTACYISSIQHFRSPSAVQKMRGGNLGFGSVARSGTGPPTRVQAGADQKYAALWLARETLSWPLIGCWYDDHQRSRGVKHVKDTLRESILAPRDCPENESSPCNPSFPTGSHLLEKIPGQLIQKIGDCFRWPSSGHSTEGGVTIRTMTFWFLSEIIKSNRKRNKARRGL